MPTSLIPAVTAKEAKEWFKYKLKVAPNPQAIMKFGRDRLTPKAMIGGMFFFFYDAKHKETLPYWDRFPLVMPIDFRKETMLGINFHYLPPKVRSLLLNKLIEISNNKMLTDKSRLTISYRLLANASKFSVVKPCIKSYLYTNVQTQFLRVPATEWKYAIALPVQMFAKAPANMVWRDSLEAALG